MKQRGVATSGFYKQNSSPAEAIATFEPDGPVTLYHNNSMKLETASDGVRVDGVLNLKRSGDHPAIRFMEDTTTRSLHGFR